MIPKLFGLAAEIASIIGDELTYRLLMERGGTQVKLPQKTTGSLIADLVGPDAAWELVDYFGAGTTLDLPCAHLRGQAGRRALGLAMVAAGGSERDIALKCNVSIRTVRNWKASIVPPAAEDDPDQPRLL